jgi:hypothetical protein
MPIDVSAVKAPPRKSTGTRTPTKATVETKSPNERRVEGLLGLAQLGQGFCLITQQWADAAAIGKHFPPVAVELANIADGNEFIAKPIDFLIEVGPYGALVTAAMPLVMQILANHKIIDASKLINQGVVPPEVLEAQMKAQVAKMQADAMREQAQAMAEAEAAQAQYQAFMTERLNEKVAA